MLNYYLAPWKKYADFSGRAQRAEYWVFELGNLLISVVLMFVGAAMSGGNENYAIIPYGLFLLANIIPNIAVTVRRMHDTTRSGWWLLISLIPLVGPIWFFVLTVLDSKPGTNKYGSNPKESQSQTPHQTNMPDGVRMS